MKWPYLIPYSSWERCNSIKTVNPCPYNRYRCLSPLSLRSLSITVPPHVSLKSYECAISIIFIAELPKWYLFNLALCFGGFIFFFLLAKFIIVVSQWSNSFFFCFFFFKAVKTLSTFSLCDWIGSEEQQGSKQITLICSQIMTFFNAANINLGGGDVFSSWLSMLTWLHHLHTIEIMKCQKH